MARIQHVGFQGLGFLAKRGFLALAFLLVARTLGPTLFGDFSYVCTWLFLVSVVLGLGLPSVSTREIARNSDCATPVLNSSLLIRLSLSLFGMVFFNVLFDLTPVGRSGIAGLALAASLALPALALSDQFAAYVLGFNAHGKFALINGTQWGLYLAGTGIALLLTRKVVSVMAFETAALWFGALGCSFWLRDDLGRARIAPRAWGTILFLLREAVPLAITSVLGILSFRVGIFMVYRLLGPRETGLYTSALQMVESMQMIPLAITGAQFPLICKVVRNRARLSGIFDKLFVTLAYLSLFVSALFSVIGSRVISLIFGQGFDSAGHLLIVLVWASVPMFLHQGMTQVLIAANRQRVFVLESVVYLLVSVTSNVLLIRKYGINGAVYAAIITESSLFGMHLIFTAPRVRMGLTLRRAVLPLAMAGSVWWFGRIWSQDLNSTLLSVVVFATGTTLLFGFPYWFYHRFWALPESGIVLSADIPANVVNIEGL